MAGPGYNIPISVSAAASTSVPQNQSAGTVFNFSSPGGGNSWLDQTANPVSTATATSAAALGDAVATTADSGNVKQNLGETDWKKIGLIGGAVVATLLVGYVIMKKVL